MEFRKSWTQYIKNTIGLAIWIFLFYLAYIYRIELRIIFFDITGSHRISNYSSILFIIIIGFFVFKTIWHFFWLRSFKIHVSDHAVSVSHGLLPWNKYFRSWDADQVHECLFGGSGFIAWLVKSGELIIVGAEGSTHKYTFPGIGRVAEACSAVNTMRRRGRLGQ